jgi:hypothetical protein
VCGGTFSNMSQLVGAGLNRCAASMKLARGVVKSALPSKVSRLSLLLSLFASPLSIHLSCV